jgi:hypothetical protein
MENDSLDEIDDLYIYIDNESISKDMCEIIINKFINDERKSKGITTDGDSKIKVTNDMVISVLNDWREIDNYLYEKLNIALNEYSKKNLKKNSGENVTTFDKLINMSHHIYGSEDFGYQVQSYKANTGYYEWHTDNIKKDFLKMNQVRVLTFIWYLNDVEIGGETEFLNFKIKPTAGKLLLFPATWTYLHKGNMPISNDKFIITGWVGRRILNDDTENK